MMAVVGVIRSLGIRGVVGVIIVVGETTANHNEMSVLGVLREEPLYAAKSRKSCWLN